MRPQRCSWLLNTPVGRLSGPDLPLIGFHSPSLSPSTFPFNLPDPPSSDPSRVNFPQLPRVNGSHNPGVPWTSLHPPSSPALERHLLPCVCSGSQRAPSFLTWFCLLTRLSVNIVSVLTTCIPSAHQRIQVSPDSLSSFFNLDHLMKLRTPILSQWTITSLSLNAL